MTNPTIAELSAAEDQKHNARVEAAVKTAAMVNPWVNCQRYWLSFCGANPDICSCRKYAIAILAAADAVIPPLRMRYSESKPFDFSDLEGDAT